MSEADLDERRTPARPHDAADALIQLRRPQRAVPRHIVGNTRGSAMDEASSPAQQHGGGEGMSTVVSRPPQEQLADRPLACVMEECGWSELHHVQMGGSVDICNHWAV